jgi:alkaline phosphatase D
MDAQAAAFLRRSWTRRRFLAAGAATVLAACSGRNARNATTSAATTSTTSLGGPKLAADPFALGVASGDPTDTAVVLWTRLLGDVGEQVVPVRWEVADDDRFTRVRRRGVAEATAELAHALHVEVGGLEPGREYWYRFHTRDYSSPLGRTRTAPTPGTAEPVRFAFASCQEFQEGYYAAWRDAAGGDLDLVLFLGDYIYEHGISDDGVRRHEAGPVVTLDEYRARYATYRADPDLQAAHAACPWLVTWDDHEVADNYADLVSGNTAEPYLEGEAFRQRRIAGYRAWYEHMPVRVPVPADEHLRIHRSVRWGSLATFVVLDTRQYRTDQTCNAVDLGLMCDEMLRDDVTLLGDEQERWLEQELDASPATWNVLANQVVFAPMPFTERGDLQLDAWDGYPLARRRLAQFLDDHGVRNPVFVTGDVHLSAVNDVHADPADPGSPVVGTELVGTSISSESDTILAANAAAIRANEHLRWIDFESRGYVRVDANAAGLTAEYRFVDAPRDSDSAVRTGTRWVVEPGRAVAEA